MKRLDFLKRLGLSALIAPSVITSLKAEKRDARFSMYDRIDPNEDTGWNWPIPYNDTVKCDGESDNTEVFDNWLKGRTIKFDTDRSVKFFDKKNEDFPLEKGILFNDGHGDNKFFYAFFRKDLKHLHISFQRKVGGSPIIYMHNLDNPENNARTLSIEFNCYLKSVLAQDNRTLYTPYLPLFITQPDGHVTTIESTRRGTWKSYS